MVIGGYLGIFTPLFCLILNYLVMSKDLSIKDCSKPGIRDKFEELKELLADAEVDADKFYGSGNKSAGVRLRKKLVMLGKLCKASKQESLDFRDKL